MRGTMSIWGLYQTDNSILDNLQIPEGVDRDILCGTLLIECAELELLYPDFDFMKMFIGLWSSKELPVWQRMLRTMELEYNPIENYDRMEEWNDAKTGNKTVNSSSTGTGLTQSTSADHLFSAGYNSDALVRTGETDSTGNSKASSTTTGTGSESSSDNNTHSGRVHGNIGVTTSQQMMEAELDLIPRLNIYDAITESFKRRFCILVYT